MLESGSLDWPRRARRLTIQKVTASASATATTAPMMTKIGDKLLVPPPARLNVVESVEVITSECSVGGMVAVDKTCVGGGCATVPAATVDDVGVDVVMVGEAVVGWADEGESVVGADEGENDEVGMAVG